MDGRIYFIQEGPDGAIKIGWGADPVSRLRAFQVGNSAVLKLLGSIPAFPDEEIGWHVRFAACQKRSEWFYPTAELLAAINAALGAEPVKPAECVPAQGRVTGADVYAWMRSEGMEVHELARKLRYSVPHVANALFVNGFSPRMAYRLEALSQGKLPAEQLLAHSRERHVDAVLDRKKRADLVAQSNAEYLIETTAGAA